MDDTSACDCNTEPLTGSRMAAFHKQASRHDQQQLELDPPTIPTSARRRSCVSGNRTLIEDEEQPEILLVGFGSLEVNWNVAGVQDQNFARPCRTVGLIAHCVPVDWAPLERDSYIHFPQQRPLLEVPTTCESDAEEPSGRHTGKHPAERRVQSSRCPSCSVRTPTRLPGALQRWSSGTVIPLVLVHWAGRHVNGCVCDEGCNAALGYADGGPAQTHTLRADRRRWGRGWSRRFSDPGVWTRHNGSVSFNQPTWPPVNSNCWLQVNDRPLERRTL